MSNGEMLTNGKAEVFTKFTNNNHLMNVNDKCRAATPRRLPVGIHPTCLITEHVTNQKMIRLDRT